MNQKLNEIIRDLYCSAPRIAPENFRSWALGKLLQAIDFDAAFWGTGHLELRQAHYTAHMDLDDHYSHRLAETIDINPIRHAILGDLGTPVAMNDVLEDDTFFSSELYQKLFEPYGIQRILGSGHHDHRSGLYTLVSIYRKDRERLFSAEEKETLRQLTYHLISAARYSLFLHLELNQAQETHHYSAICDKHGYYFETQSGFLDLIEQHFPEHQSSQLPIKISTETAHYSHELVINCISMGDLFLIKARPANPLDHLTDREREIVQWISKGLTFKEVGRQLHVAPSTVSNHLYRIYSKLGVNSRTELAKMIHEQ